MVQDSPTRSGSHEPCSSLLAVMPSFGVTPNLQTLLFVPGVVLLIMFSLGLGLVLSAMHVYFRDVKFLVQAALLVLIYITPVLYPKHLLGNFGAWLDLNPLTGIVTIFHMATVGSGGPWARPVFISCIATLALVLTGAEVHRHHDRLFVDQL
jgi:ABC-type polysaccharide/polyol phosphate export permease